jgi:DNA (cytosine-5)-methyltransferase 1
MSPTRPAATITTASGHIGSAFTIHPSQNRVLSPLECSLIQTIPRSFRWGDTLERFGVSVIRDMIGEAVPPRFTAKHGRILVKSLRVEDHRSTHAARLLNFDGD